MSVRTIVLFGALAWVSGSLLVIMNRGALAEGRVAGVSTVAAAPAKAPLGDAIVSAANDKTLYLRRGEKVWRIADTATLRQLAKQVSARDGRANLYGLKLVGTVNAQNVGEVMSVAQLRPVPVDDGVGSPAPSQLRVRVDSRTPPPATLPDGTQLNPVLALRIQSLSRLPVRLTSLTLTQEYAYLASTGTSTLPTSTVFDGATVWEGTSRHGSRGVFGANLRATVDMAADPIVIPPRGTGVLLVKADLPANAPIRLGDYGVRLAVAAAADVIQTDGSIIGTTFPLRGSLFSWVDGSSSVAEASVIGVATEGYISQPGATTTPNVFQGNQQPLFRFNLADQNDVEAIVVRQVVVRLSGTVQDGDLVNFRLVPGLTQFPFATATAAINGVVTFNLPQPFINLPGTNATFNVYAEPATGVTGRWFSMSLVEPSDLMLQGGSSGVTIYPSASWPVVSFGGYWVTGDSMAVALQVAVDSSASSTMAVVRGGIGQPIAQFVFSNYGSPVMLLNLQLNMQPFASFTTSSLTNLRLIDVATGNVMSLVNGPVGLQNTLPIQSGAGMQTGESRSIRIVATVGANVALGELASSLVPAGGLTAHSGFGQVGSSTAEAVGQVILVFP